MKSLIKTTATILLPVIILAMTGSSQTATTEVTVLNELLFNDPRIFEPPMNGIALQKKLAFPAEPLTAVARLAGNAEGTIFAPDPSMKVVLKYTSAGEPAGRCEAAGQAWKHLSAPHQVAIGTYRVFIEDVVRQELGVFSMEGKRLKTLGIIDPVDFSVNAGGLLFVAPPVKSKEGPLIEVYTPEGAKTAAFGEPIHVPFVDPELDSIRLATQSNGHILAAFRYFPILRTYSPKGELLSDFRIETPITAVKEKFNLKRIGEGIANVGRRFGYVPIFSAMAVLGERIFLLSCFPRLDILEVNNDGKIVADYWNDDEEITEAGDLLVRQVAGKFVFYVLRISPRRDIIMFATKEDNGRHEVLNAK